MFVNIPSNLSNFNKSIFGICKKTDLNNIGKLYKMIETLHCECRYLFLCFSEICFHLNCHHQLLSESHHFALHRMNNQPNVESYLNCNQLWSITKIIFKFSAKSISEDNLIFFNSIRKSKFNLMLYFKYANIYTLDILNNSLYTSNRTAFIISNLVYFSPIILHITEVVS